MIPGLERFPGEGNGNPLKYSCLENAIDKGACRATIHGVAKSWTQLRTEHAHSHFVSCWQSCKVPEAVVGTPSDLSMGHTSRKNRLILPPPAPVQEAGAPPRFEDSGDLCQELLKLDLEPQLELTVAVLCRIYRIKRAQSCCLEWMLWGFTFMTLRTG